MPNVLKVVASKSALDGYGVTEYILDDGSVVGMAGIDDAETIKAIIAYIEAGKAFLLFEQSYFSDAPDAEVLYQPTKH